MADEAPNPATGPAPPATPSPGCPCVCTCVPLTKAEGGESVVPTAHGSYVVMPSGPPRQRFVAYPQYAVGEDVGYGIGTSPEGTRDLSHILLDAQFVAQDEGPLLGGWAPDVVVPTMPLPVEARSEPQAREAGMPPQLALQAQGVLAARTQPLASRVTAAEGGAAAPTATTMSAGVAAPFAHDLVVAPGIAGGGADGTGGAATAAGQGAREPLGRSALARGDEASFAILDRRLPFPWTAPVTPASEYPLPASGPASPGREWPEPWRIEIPGRDPIDLSIFNAPPPPPLPPIGLPPGPPSGGGGKAPPVLRDIETQRAPIPPPQMPPPPQPPAPRPHVLGQGDRLKRAIQPPPHPEAAAGVRVLTPGGQVDALAPPGTTQTVTLSAGGALSPRTAVRPPSVPRLRPGGGRLPFEEAPVEPEAAPAPPSLALLAPPMASVELPAEKKKKGTDYGAEIEAGRQASTPRVVEPDVAGRGPAQAAPVPLVPGQIPSALARALGVEVVGPRGHVAPQSFAGRRILLPEASQDAADYGTPQLERPGPEARQAVRAPEDGLVPPLAAAPKFVSLEAPSGSASDLEDSLLALRVPRGPTLVPEGTLAGIFAAPSGGAAGGAPGGAASAGAGAPAGGLAPPVVLGGNAAPRRGKPSGSTATYASARSARADAYEAAAATLARIDDLRAQAEEYQAEADSLYAAAKATQAAGDSAKGQAQFEQALAKLGEAQTLLAEAATEQPYADYERGAAEEYDRQADDALAKVVQENPHTGLALAEAESSRLSAQARRAESRKESSPYYQHKEAVQQSRERYKETQQDAKQRRKLGENSQEYKDWRLRQDAIEGTKDRRVQRALDGKAETNARAKQAIADLERQLGDKTLSATQRRALQDALQEAQRAERGTRETKDDRRQREEMARREAERAKRRGSFGPTPSFRTRPPSPSHVVPRGSPDQPLAAGGLGQSPPLTPSEDPCLACYWLPPCTECPPGTACKCAPGSKPGGGPPSGGGGGGGGGGGPGAAAPGRARGPDGYAPDQPPKSPEHTYPEAKPPRPRPPPPTADSDQEGPCDRARRICEDARERAEMLAEMYDTLNQQRLGLAAEAGNRASGGGTLSAARWKTLEEAAQKQEIYFPTSARLIASMFQAGQDLPCYSWIDCAEAAAGLDHEQQMLQGNADFLAVFQTACLLALRLDGALDIDLADLLSPVSALMKALGFLVLGGGTHEAFMDLARFLRDASIRKEGFQAVLQEKMGGISADLDRVQIWNTILEWADRVGMVVGVAGLVAFGARALVRITTRLKVFGRSGTRAAQAAEGVTAAGTRGLRDPPPPPPLRTGTGRRPPVAPESTGGTLAGGRPSPARPDLPPPQQIPAGKAAGEAGKGARPPVAPEGTAPPSGPASRGAPRQPASSGQTPGRAEIRRRSPSGEGGRGLIGLVKPRGTIDETLREVYVQIAGSPQMTKAVERYNQVARYLRQRPSASIDEIVEAIGKDVTFSRIGTLRSGVFVPGKHPGTTKFWVQGNPTTAYGERVARHELVHLGAALKGQGDTFLHEIAVQAATTPEGLAIGAGMIVAAGGAVYWVASE